MIPPHPRRIAAMVGAVFALLVIGGCGDAEIDAAPIHDLSEPWQPRPFAVDVALITAAEKLCRDTWADTMPAGMQLVVVDARGGNNMLLLFAGPAGDNECFLVREPTGQLKTTGGGGSSGPAQPQLGPNELQGQGTVSQSTGGDVNGPQSSLSYTLGRAGANIAAVDVVLSSGGPIRASLNRGFFAAWWPSGDTQLQVRGYDAGGNVVGSAQ